VSAVVWDRLELPLETIWKGIVSAIVIVISRLLVWNHPAGVETEIGKERTDQNGHQEEIAIASGTENEGDRGSEIVTETDGIEKIAIRTGKIEKIGTRTEKIGTKTVKAGTKTVKDGTKIETKIANAVDTDLETGKVSGIERIVTGIAIEIGIAIVAGIVKIDQRREEMMLRWQQGITPTSSSRNTVKGMETMEIIHMKKKMIRT
jgi:hypothetical protein